jgi:hypothetical protein
MKYIASILIGLIFISCALSKNKKAMNSELQKSSLDDLGAVVTKEKFDGIISYYPSLLNE